MEKISHLAARKVGPRGVRLIMVSLGLLFMALLGAWSMMGIMALFNAGHPLRAAFLAMAPLLLVLLAARIIALNWQPAEPDAGRSAVSPEGTDQTGNWGVGGPSMREPGSTGVWPTRSVDRRYDERDT